VDNSGSRTSKTDKLANVTSNYAYDPIYQLTGVTQGVGTTESYTYDLVGNRLTSTTGNYAYNNSNELTSSPTATFTFDNNGNSLTKTDSTGTTNYAWDFENRFTSVTLPGTGGTVTFNYDPLADESRKPSPKTEPQLPRTSSMTRTT
jgi:YD repeat-containing protein